MEKIQTYLRKFDYGNQDFSGGLTHAWLSSSLKISAIEQMKFLTALVSLQLSISKQAMTKVKENMYLQNFENGWKLHGKTGTGSQGQKKIGWFLGFLQKENQTYLFVLNFTDEHPSKSSAPAGQNARSMVEDILHTTGLFL